MRWFGWFRRKVELPAILHVRGPRPEGYALVKNMFLEADGTRQDAYVRVGAKGNLSIDVLNPGEEIEFAVSLVPVNYLLGLDENGRFIRCMNCGRTSYNPFDILEKYCGHCHSYLTTKVKV